MNMKLLATTLNLVLLKLFFLKKSPLKFINKNTDENEIQYQTLKDSSNYFRMTLSIPPSSELICNKIRENIM